MRKLLLISLLGSSFLGTLQAQDFHYSQFHNAPFLLSPGLTGVFQGHVRSLAKYRNQWENVGAGYHTLSVGYDMRHLAKGDKSWFFSHGLVLYYDQAGETRYYTTSLQALGAFTLRLSQHFYGTAGIKIGPSFEGFRPSTISTDSQFDPFTGRPDNSLPSGEESNIRTDFISYFDFSAGINFRYQKLDNCELIDQKQDRTRIDFGLGLFHLNQPNKSFIEGGENRLAIRTSLYGIYYQELSPDMDFMGAHRTQVQLPDLENMTTLGLKLYLSKTLGRQFALQVNISFRYHGKLDAVVPGVELFYNDLQAGISYDLNTSPLVRATQTNGGPMIFLAYTFKKVSKPCTRSCPII